MTSPAENAEYLLKRAREAGISERRELAIFMGQMQVESGGFRSMHERLNYSPSRLLEMFGPRTDRHGVWRDGRNGLTSLPEAQAITSRGREGIAEAIYGGSWGARNLGNVEPGDGWKYHGRGYVQLTGRANYERIGRELGMDLVNHPNLASNRDVAATIAIHYWMQRVRMNGHELDVEKATRDINGGQNHLQQRRDAARAWEQRIEPGRLDGIAQQESPPRRRADPSGREAERVPPRGSGSRLVLGEAIYTEAHRHFLADGNRYEYGRPDTSSRNREGNGLTDRSRNGGDSDGDGLKGVDCSAFVWRGLRNAGYDVPAAPFTTRTLFNSHQVTPYAHERFDVIPASGAARSHGRLQRGDILLFKDRDSAGQHVGIFKGYDASGHIQFIGSQVSTGPGQQTAAPGDYWNGREFEIVGALRAKPEFQVRAPVHAGADIEPRHDSRTPQPAARTARTQTARRAPEADIDALLEPGDHGPTVTRLQRRLADLDYRGADGRALGVDGVFGPQTKHALQAFQREHGLEGKGVAGPRTEQALEHAERTLVSHPSHPHHRLYTQVLDRVHAEERAKGIAPGHHSQRIAAALAVECLREGIDRVDRVELNRDATLVRGVQTGTLRDEPGLNRVTDPISTRQASRQTLLESSEQIQQVAVNLQARLQDEQRVQARAAPMPMP